MRRVIVLLIALSSFNLAIARDFTLAWDEVVTDIPIADINHGYDNTQTFYELRTKKNNDDWVYSITQPQQTQITRNIPIVPQDELIVQIRTRAGSSWICNKSANLDCDKSAWVTFDSLPTANTPIIYPNTPSNLQVVKLEGLQLLSASLGSYIGSINKIDNSWVMIARGHDIWGTSDGGYFGYIAKSGDFTITARVLEIQRPPPHGWAKSGIMIRESLAANSKHVFMAITGSNGVAFQSRATTGGTSIHVGTTGIQEPVYVRLSRSGHVFTASYSVNGVNWTSFSNRTITMSGNVYAGLASTSHDVNSFQTIFDNLDGF